MRNVDTLETGDSRNSSSRSITSRSSSDPGLISLEKLALANLMEISDESAVELIRTYGRGLEHLDISGCVLLSDQSIVEVRSQCSKLKHLDISSLPNVSSGVMIALFIANPFVESGTSPEAVESYADMVESIGPLQYVNLQGNVNATDDVLVCLSELSGQTLKSLNINGCNRLTTRAIMALALNCPCLEEIDMSFCRGAINEDAVGFLVDNSVHLRKLFVWGCSHLSSKFFDGHIRYDLEVVGRMIA